MREKFKELTEKYPNHSSFIVYTKVIKGSGYSKGVVSKWFKLLVDSSDYLISEKKELLNWLFQMAQNKVILGQKGAK
jgi:hypothetical protein